MNTSTTNNVYNPGTHVVKPIPFKAHRLIGLSDKLLESHYENIYGGAVRRLNDIESRLADFKWNAASGIEINGIKREQLVAANSMLLHEVYFDSIGEEGGEALSVDLAEVITKGFGSVAHWQTEFTAMAKALAGGSGWVLLVWSERFGRLINDWTNEHSNSLAGATPILALDMYEHAYHMDYGPNESAYVDAFMHNIHWGRVNKRLKRACNLAEKTESAVRDQQIDAAELKSILENPETQPLVLDVRHTDDRERSGLRILETPWRDSHCVSDWAEEFPKDKPIVVYCAYGFWVSEDAAKELRSLGYDARILQGGLVAWRAMGYSTTAAE